MENAGLQNLAINLATAGFEQVVSSHLTTLEGSGSASGGLTLTYVKDENAMEVDSSLQALNKLAAMPGMNWQILTSIRLQGLRLKGVVPDALARCLTHMSSLHLDSCIIASINAPNDAITYPASVGQEVENMPDFDIYAQLGNATPTATPCPQLATLTVVNCTTEWHNLYNDRFLRDEKRHDGKLKRFWELMDDAGRLKAKMKLALERPHVTPAQMQQLKDRLTELDNVWTRHEARLNEELELTRQQMGIMRDKFNEYNTTDMNGNALPNAVVPDIDGPPVPIPGENDDLWNAPWQHDLAAIPPQTLVEKVRPTQARIVQDFYKTLKQNETSVLGSINKIQENRAKEQTNMDKYLRVANNVKLVYKNIKTLDRLMEQQKLQMVEQMIKALPNVRIMKLQGTYPAGLINAAIACADRMAQISVEGGSEYYNQIPDPEAGGGAEGDAAAKPSAAQRTYLSPLDMSQFANLTHLQMLNAVNAESMTALLQLPSLQHLTAMVRLESSVASAACKLHTMCAVIDASDDVSVPQQISYLPVANLQAPLAVALVGQRIAIPEDAAVQQYVEQLQAAVQNTGTRGITWVRDDFDKVGEPLTAPDQIVFDWQGHDTSSPEDTAALQGISQLLGSRQITGVTMDCNPLTSPLLSVAMQHLSRPTTTQLDLSKCESVSPEVKQNLMSLLPASITEVVFSLGGANLGFSLEDLKSICVSVTRPLKIVCKTDANASAEHQAAARDQLAAVGNANIQITVEAVA